MSGTYYCTLTVPNAGSNTGPVVPTQDLVCTASRPVVNVTRVSHPVPQPVWLQLLTVLGVVIVVITVAIWRTAVVTSDRYKSRRDRQIEVMKEKQRHDERMAELEVERQRAIADQVYPPLPGERVER